MDALEIQSRNVFRLFTDIVAQCGPSGQRFANTISKADERRRRYTHSTTAYHTKALVPTCLSGSDFS